MVKSLTLKHIIVMLLLEWREEEDREMVQLIGCEEKCNKKHGS